tara:strand:+ start:6984 stop:9725 length:2742 start_codon:yes stop_codon:yes gene_type:complete
MSKSKFINPEKYSTISQRYDDLLAEGIELIQKFSGDQWTDYNYHDPGITILEQLCYAITDLGYKTNFPIEDLLLLSKDKYDLENNNLFLPPEKIFSSKPITINDYKKLIIDSIENVNNAWFEVVHNHKLGISGLFNVKLQLKDNLDDFIINDTVKETKKILLKNRALSTDINNINVLKKDVISIVSDVYLDSFVVGEDVLANIFYKIESKLNSKVHYHNYDDAIKRGMRLEDVYSGFVTSNGLIKNEDLIEKTSEIYVSEIEEIIKNIEGVTSVSNLHVYKNGIKVFDDVISFDHNSYPSLENVDTYFSNNSEGNISFYRNNNLYKVDNVIFSQIYDALCLSNNIILKRSSAFNSVDRYKGRFNKKELEKYYSIINEFPSVYGLKRHELLSDESNSRIAKVRQLKSYLLLFDQLMANHLSQLANTRNYFSISDDNHQTYYSQFVEQVSDIEDVILNHDQKDFTQHLNKIGETQNQFFNRRNQVVDHLLARFGETYDSSVISKMYQLQNPNLNPQEINIYALNAKLNYAKNILSLGRNRNISSNYLESFETQFNCSGLERRLQLLLNFRNNKIYPEFSYFEKNQISIKQKHKWSLIEVKIKNGPKVKMNALNDSCYKNSKVNFFIENYNSFKYLFHNASLKKSYLIQEDSKGYFILFNSPNQSLPSRIFVSSSKDECKNKINTLIEKFNKLNLQHEGFFMLENILLRPLDDEIHCLQLKLKDKLILESVEDLETSSIEDLKNNLHLFLFNKNNFSITQEKRKFRIKVYDILDNLIFESVDLYESKKYCQELVEMFLKFFTNKDKLLKHCDVQIKNISHNKFPEKFNYSNHVSFIFSDWPFRNQNKEFRSYINKCIKEYIPAHLNYDIFYLNINDMLNFSQVFKDWKMSKKECVNIEENALQLIQLIDQLKRKYG